MEGISHIIIARGNDELRVLSHQVATLFSSNVSIYIKRRLNAGFGRLSLVAKEIRIRIGRKLVRRHLLGLDDTIKILVETQTAIVTNVQSE